MNRPELYHKTIETLRVAYYDGTLEHSKCITCAVGIICSPYLNQFGLGPAAWASKFMTSRSSDGVVQLFAEKGERVVLRGNIFRKTHIVVKCSELPPHFCNDEDKLYEALGLTGYTIKELAEIEHVFEAAPGYDIHAPHTAMFRDPEWLYNGIVAVVDALGRIHEAADDETASSKAKFEKLVPNDEVSV